MQKVYKIPQNGGATLHSLGAFRAVLLLLDLRIGGIGDHKLEIRGRSKNWNIVIVIFW